MSGLKILFVTRNVPYPAIAGSSQRTANLIAALRCHGDVQLFVIGPPDRKAYLESAGYCVTATAELTARRRSLLGRVIEKVIPGKADEVWRALAGVQIDFTPDRGLNESLKRLLARERYDLIVGRYLIPSAQAGIFEPGLPPVIVDVDDVDSKAVSAKINSPASGALLRAVLRLRLPAVKRYETSLYSKATRLWFSNLDDIQLASSKGDLVPNIPFTLPARQTLVHSSESSKIILWVGSFNHRVNLEGVELFLRHTWPAILGTCLGARFRIVGSGLADGVRRRWESISGVDVVGYAESLAPHYADAALSIVPLMDGAGTKIKVLESLGYMRTCVVTKHSIAGFESLLRNGESVRTVSSLEGLPAVVEELLSQPKLRHQMEERGRAIIDSHFTSFAVQDAVRQSLECLGGQLLSV